MASTSGMYKVKTINEGCSSPAKVTVNAIPGIPTITQEPNGSLTSSSSKLNQWYLNDLKIDKANQKSFTPTQGGSYSVKVESPCGKEVSKPKVIIITGIEESILRQVNVFPNPISNFFRVNFPFEFCQTVQVKVIDHSGTVRMAKSMVIDGEQLDLSQLNTGNYFLRIHSNDNSNSKSIKISKIVS